MSIQSVRRLRTYPRRWPVALVVVVGLAVGCSGSDDATSPATSAPAATTSTTIAVTDTVPQVPAASPEAAVTAVLQAEQDGDHATSFGLLSDAARRLYKDQAEWQDRRNELAPITGFTVEDVEKGQVTVLVTHQPGLDPFLGLSAGTERQVWVAEAAEGGWLVDAEPDTDYVLPSDDDAQQAAVAWVRSVQACDDDAAAEQQALPTLYGSSTLLPDLCGTKGDPVAGPVADLEAGPASADIVAQYSSDALIWARSIPVTISGASITIALAPIGDVWKVMGVSD